MSEAEWKHWQAGISPEQAARDIANNSAQAAALLDYALTMGWLRQRTLEAEARIEAQASAQDGPPSLRIDAVGAGS